MQIGARTTGGIISTTLLAGGSGYTAPPAITVSGGGGTGASLAACMAGTVIDSVVIVNQGTGYTSAPTVTVAGTGGASATAGVYAGSLRPISFFKGRYNDVYGVDGMGRGFRWDGVSASVQPIGIRKPFTGPAVSATSSTASGNQYVKSIQIVNQGGGYANVPTVTLTGGSFTKEAKATANIANGRLTSITVDEPGSGYMSTPTISIDGGLANGASFSVGLSGSVDSISLTAMGTGYTSNATTSPTVVFASSQGLTQAAASVVVDELGRISGISLLSAGTGATTSGVTAEVVGGGGTGAVISPRMRYSIAAVTVATSGAGFYTPPLLTFRAATGDSYGSGAAATAAISDGGISSVTMVAGGRYYDVPSVVVLDTTAKAVATMASSFLGAYQCCLRYIDATPEVQGGPRPSSISALVKIEAASSTNGLQWTLPSDTNVDARVTAAELWRTTADQSVVLFRVATIARDNWAAGYTDTMPDSTLQDTTREQYGLMPITLPSGQINARRFEVPLGNFAVACLFQDRVWYALDTLGLRPNSLLYSEIDEPESVPDANELVVQENTATPDKIVALIPLGSQLLIAQTNHLYALNYVAQPVLDASIMLKAYRGVLNPRCWDILGGVAFLVDSNGMYAFDGNSEEAISVPVDNYWRTKIIDLTKADQFHVRCEQLTRVVRFYYCQQADSAPTRALCYCIATKAWWEETYPVAITATCPTVIGNSYSPISGSAGGYFLKSAGNADPGASVPYAFRSGNMTLSEEQNRSIAILYKPTTEDNLSKVSLYYNNSSDPRANAISTDRGSGFTTTAGDTGAVLNQKKTLALGDANGFARAYYAGHRNDRASGGDRHVSVAVSGEQAAADAVILYGLTVEGVE